MAKSTKAAKATKLKLTKPKAVKPKAIKLKAADAPRKKKRRAASTPDVSAHVLDRLWNVVLSRRNADPTVSHSARLLSRGSAKVAQKFGEEAVECVIEAVSGNHDAVIAESADVLYHLLVVWVACGVKPDDVWEELHRREGVSGIAEKAARPSIAKVARKLQTTKIP